MTSFHWQSMAVFLDFRSVRKSFLTKVILLVILRPFTALFLTPTLIPFFLPSISLMPEPKSNHLASLLFSTACLATLRSIIIVDLHGLEKLTPAFGLLLLPQGIATIIGTPFAG